MIPFEIGMRILPLLEFKTFPEQMTVVPGTAREIQVNVFNNSKKHFKGSVFAVDEENRLFLGKTDIPIETPPKSHAGFSIGVRVPEYQPTSVIPLELRARGKVKGTGVETRTERIYVKCLRPGGIVTSFERRAQERLVIVENEELVAHVQLRGALLNITYKNTSYGYQNLWLRGGFGVGPPFGFAKPIDYDYEVIKKPESIELVLTGLHPDKPGIKMMRILTFYAGASLIKEQIRIINTNPEIAYEVEVRTGGQSSARNIFKMIVPLEEIIEHEMIAFPVSESDLPTDPKDYRESWICFQNRAQDFCFGQIWSHEKMSKIRIGPQTLLTPEYKLGQIQPGQAASTSEFYYFIENGDWRAVRMKWQSLVEKRTGPEEEHAKSQPLLNIVLANHTLYDRKELRTQLKVVNFRNMEAAGEIVFTPPRGWSITPSKVRVKGVAMKKPFASKVSLHPPRQAKLGVHSGAVDFYTDRQVIRFPLDVCLLSRNAKRSISVVQGTEENKVVQTVYNGLIRFKASAEFAGCLYFLSGKDGVNQLCSSFPRIGTKVFLENYSGGIRALYLGDGFEFAKTKSHEETYEARAIKEELWKGVKFSYESRQQEQIKGVLGSVSYSTLPLSNIVRIRRKFENPTSSRFRFYSCLWISPNVGGKIEANEAVFPRGNRIFRFRRSEGVVVSGVQQEKGWAFVANEEQKTGLGIVAGNTDKSMIISIDIGKALLELLVMSEVQLQPKQSCELQDYIVLTNEDHETIDKFSEALRRM